MSAAPTGPPREGAPGSGIGPRSAPGAPLCCAAAWAGGGVRGRGGFELLLTARPAARARGAPGVRACFSNCKVGPRASGLEVGEAAGGEARRVHSHPAVARGGVVPRGQMAAVDSPSVCAPAPRRAQTLSLKVRLKVKHPALSVRAAVTSAHPITCAHFLETLRLSWGNRTAYCDG